MATIIIYTTETCPYCVRAKQLFDRKGAHYEELRVDLDPAARDAMLKRSNGRRSVPQIFINGQHIGGCDDLMALDAAGKLDALLKN
jgi:glutaredoxin 3